MITQQQPHVGMEGAVYLADAWRFVCRSRRWILTAALLAALMAGGVVAWTPTAFRSSALLTVVSERPGAEFSPPMLSYEGYLRLLKSRPVLAETFRRAEALEPSASVQTSRLIPSLLSSRRGEFGNASLLELLVESPTAEAAATVANAWAEVYLELDLRQSRTAAMRTASHELQAEEQKALEKLLLARNRLVAIKAQLKETPLTLNLQSRLTDRELLSGSKSEPGAALMTQEPNPLFTQLAIEMVAVEGEVGSHEQVIARTTAAQRSLKERLDLLAKMTGEDREEMDPAVSLEPVEGVALPLYGSAHLMSRAVAPRHPEATHALAKILLATLGGAILGLLMVALREAVQVLPAPAVPTRDSTS